MHPQAWQHRTFVTGPLGSYEESFTVTLGLWAALFVDAPEVLHFAHHSEGHRVGVE